MRLLIVDDDVKLLNLLKLSLEKHYPLDAVGNIDEAMDYLQAYRYDVIILDRNFRGIDEGLSLIASIKASSPNTAILIASAFGTVEDKIEGLTLGADDYIEKPFDIGELQARIEALSRRFAAKTITIGPLTFDMVNKTVHNGPILLLLSKKESGLLFYLLSRRGQIVSRDEIIESLYRNPEDLSSNTIEVMINNIRKKLPLDIITTVKTRGYLIENP